MDYGWTMYDIRHLCDILININCDQVCMCVCVYDSMCSRCVVSVSISLFTGTDGSTPGNGVCWNGKEQPCGIEERSDCQWTKQQQFHINKRPTVSQVSPKPPTRRLAGMQSGNAMAICQFPAFSHAVIAAL